MQTTLKTLVDRPIIHGNQIIGYEFPNALRKLGEDPLPVIARFSISSALLTVNTWVQSYEEFRQARMRELSKLRSVVLMEEAKRIRGEAARPQLSVPPEKLEWDAEQIRGTAKDEHVFTMEAMQQFHKDLQEQQNTVVEIASIAGPIKLPEGSKLTAHEMMVLGPFITV